MMKNVDNDDDSSSDNSVFDEPDEGEAGKKRGKRDVSGIAWCGVDTEKVSRHPRPKIQWPPESMSSNWRNLRPVRMGNPFFQKMQLYSKTNYNLAIYPDGAVRGTKDDNDVHTFLELISAGATGHVRIRGILTNLYVAMDHKGRLYGEIDMTNIATVFVEAFQASYKTYLSLKYAHLGWYLGIKKSGKYKKGPKTAFGQKAIMFLSRRSKFE